jgi:hypothetical protein
MSNYGVSISLSQFNDAVQNFNWLYAQQNPGTSTLDLYCDCAQFNTILSINPGWQNVANQGINLEYMVTDVGYGSPYYSFSITAVAIDNQNKLTSIAGVDPFCIIPGGGIYVFDNPQKIQQMNVGIQAFSNVFLKNISQLNTPNQVQVSQLPNHPKSVFFTQAAVYQFLADNDGILLPRPLNLHLNLGAVYCPIISPAPNAQYQCATPLFWLEEAARRYLSDIYNEFTLIFDDRGLGLGKHCPPNC